jgi:hypothetical protein
MFASVGLAAVMMGIGALAIVSAWLLHWILIVVGAVLIAVGVYLAFVGSLGPI